MHIINKVMAFSSADVLRGWKSVDHRILITTVEDDQHVEFHQSIHHQLQLFVVFLTFSAGKKSFCSRISSLNIIESIGERDLTLIFLSECQAMEWFPVKELVLSSGEHRFARLFFSLLPPPPSRGVMKSRLRETPIRRKDSISSTKQIREGSISFAGAFFFDQSTNKSQKKKTSQPSKQHSIKKRGFASHCIPMAVEGDVTSLTLDSERTEIPHVLLKGRMWYSLTLDKERGETISMTPLKKILLICSELFQMSFRLFEENWLILLVSRRELTSHSISTSPSPLSTGGKISSCSFLLPLSTIIDTIIHVIWITEWFLDQRSTMEKNRQSSDRIFSLGIFPSPLFYLCSVVSKEEFCQTFVMQEQQQGEDLHPTNIDDDEEERPQSHRREMDPGFSISLSEEMESDPPEAHCISSICLWEEKMDKGERTSRRYWSEGRMRNLASSTLLVRSRSSLPLDLWMFRVMNNLTLTEKCRLISLVSSIIFFS